MPPIRDIGDFKETGLRKTPGSGRAAEGTPVKEKAQCSPDTAKRASNG